MDGGGGGARSVRASENAQDGSTRVPENPGGPPGWLRAARDGSHHAPRRPKTAPQDKTAPRGLKAPPTAPKTPTSFQNL
eukprot:5891584-Pyramimonas_sp.AAC.1